MLSPVRLMTNPPPPQTSSNVTTNKDDPASKKDDTLSIGLETVKVWQVSVCVYVCVLT